MGRETIERCDVCKQIVSAVLRSQNEHSLRHDGYGYIQVRRIEWEFGPWPRWWHREDRGVEYVCDLCLDAVREIRARAALASRDPEEDA